jgi:hypothetical protein
MESRGAGGSDEEEQKRKKENTIRQAERVRDKKECGSKVTGEKRERLESNH